MKHAYHEQLKAQIAAADAAALAAADRRRATDCAYHMGRAIAYREVLALSHLSRARFWASEGATQSPHFTVSIIPQKEYG